MNRLLVAVLLIVVVGLGVVAFFTFSGRVDHHGEVVEEEEVGPGPDEVDPSTVHMPYVEPYIDRGTAFVVGGVNSTELIRGLPSINGRSIADLENDLRPTKDPGIEHQSSSGFLTTEQRLLDVMSADNDVVLNELRLTHQKLGRSLKAIYATAKSLDKTHRQEQQITFRGRRFLVKWVQYKGTQLSPFLDNTLTSVDMTLLNEDNGKSLRCSMLVPEMIERYGFYEGPGLRYRLDPRNIAEVLDFLKPSRTPPHPER